MLDRQVDIHEAEKRQTVWLWKVKSMYVAADNRLLGIIAVADVVKEIVLKPLKSSMIWN